ncbi:Crp/Fnr family transcriptional regulator [Oryzomonas sagensis]|uniref:Crp/Fnr family transcriptional regulator n=1 Tax=Oryzomonas sagensis TaxID=2603857 RepID=A0ABQ6TNG9_9BACT|nr:Crp/Fnr family transcriptional regulator [Oryzomonas sagensis]KAB0670197.1 Crp/Fnr family transcriptional regulator [Oryzomonas sagensis]
MMIRRAFDPELATRIVKDVPLFISFSDEEIAELLEKTAIYSYHKDEIIINADEHIEQMYIILKGRVRVVDLSSSGEERVMAFRHRGDYFGDMGLLDGKTDFATVVATEPCKVLLIGKSAFDEFFLNNNKALRQVITVLCQRLRESWLFHNVIGINDAESKIRATLAHYSTTLGTRNSHGIIINSIFSQQSIADRVQITRETVTRVLRKMKEQHEIEMVGRHFKLMPTFFDKYRQSQLYKNLSSDF